MTLQINKNDPEIGESFSDRDDFWYQRIEIVDCERDQYEKTIEYEDKHERKKYIMLTITNTG